MRTRAATWAVTSGLLALLLAAPPADAGRRDDEHRGSHRHERDARARCDADGANPFLARLVAHRAQRRGHGWGPLWLRDDHPGRHHRHGHLPAPPWGLCPSGSEQPEGGEAPPAPLPLVDASGATIGELGQVEIGDAPSAVALSAAFVDPLVIVGPATAHEADGGVVRVSGVTPEGFQVRFEEWAHLDGAHGPESVSYLVLEAGRHVMADGSIWEAGAFDLGGEGVWQDQTFAAGFAAAPAVFLGVQSEVEVDPVMIRAREVSATRFQAALFEAEGARNGHAVERVAYLAVESPARSGRLGAGADELPYLVRSVTADEQPVPVLSSSLWLQEETSGDAELDHADEQLDFLAVGSGVFAQVVSTWGIDPFEIRRATPEHEAALEWGTLADVDHTWQTVPLARRYENPVVIAKPLSSNGLDPGVLRIRNVSPDGFEVRIQEWSYTDQVHAYERAFFLVAEAGIQSVGGLVVEAGRQETGALVGQGWEDIPFHAPLPEAPAVFASTMTANESDAVTVRIAERTASGFRAALQEEEARTDGHAPETLGWIAVQKGQGLTTDGRVLAVFDAAADDAWTPIAFGQTLRGRFPFLLGQVGSTNDADPAGLRYEGLAPDGVAVFVQEEQSLDAETSHAMEDVSLLVAE